MVVFGMGKTRPSRFIFAVVTHAAYSSRNVCPHGRFLPKGGVVTVDVISIRWFPVVASRVPVYDSRAPRICSSRGGLLPAFINAFPEFVGNPVVRLKRV